MLPGARRPEERLSSRIGSLSWPAEEEGCACGEEEGGKPRCFDQIPMTRHRFIIRRVRMARSFGTTAPVNTLGPARVGPDMI